MPLQDLPPDARPREKLLARGPGALSDVELLALLHGQQFARRMVDRLHLFPLKPTCRRADEPCQCAECDGNRSQYRGEDKQQRH